MDEILKYVNIRIKQLENEEIESINNIDFDTAWRYGFAICELMDVKTEINNLIWAKIEKKLK